MKMAVFWAVVSCSLVEGYRRFRGDCCLHNECPSYLHLRPDDGGSKHL
jgi:hypothetical protein